MSSVPGSWRASAEARDARRLAGRDQGLVEPARRLGAEDLGEDLDGGELGMRAGRDVIDHADQADAADPPQGHEPLAVLGRLLGVGGRQLPLGPGDRAEVLLDVLERPSSRRTGRRRPAPRCPAGRTACRKRAGCRRARARCRCGCRWWTCRSCATRRRRPSSAARARARGEFSPDSNSLRTTENSVARSSALIGLLIIRSASRRMANSRFSSLAGSVS